MKAIVRGNRKRGRKTLGSVTWKYKMQAMCGEKTVNTCTSDVAKGANGWK